MNNFVTTESKIIRVKHTGNFTQINNQFLRDKNISIKAKGLLCTVMSLPDEWVIKKTTLHQFSNDGITATMTAFNELIKAGYILEKKERIKGRFTYLYFISDYPLNNNHNGFSDMVNPQQINTVKLNTGEVNTIEVKTTASAVVSIDQLDQLTVYMKESLKAK